MKRLLKLNLQYFSEETHPFAEAAAPAEPHPFAADASESAFAKFTDVPNPLYNDFQAPETPELQSQDQGLEGVESAAAQVEKLNFGGREVDVVDPIIHDLHKDYSHLNRELTQKAQELSEARQLAEQWQQLAQQKQPTAEPSTPQQTPQETGISQERQQQLNEQYMELMYENKFAADQWWNEQPEIVALNQERQRAEFQEALNERLAPIEQERQALQAQQVANEFIQSHPDFEEHKDVMQGILNENPNLEGLPNVLDVLYAMAKVQKTPNSFDDMLADPINQQKVLENEQIRTKIFQNYQQTKLQVNQQLPNIMGNPVGSQTPMSVGESAPRSIAEATRSWLRSQGQ